MSATQPKPLLQADGYCSPARAKDYQQRGSCLRKDELVLAAEAYNASVKQPSQRIRINKSASHAQLLAELKARMPRAAPQCYNGDHCVLDIPAIAKNATVSSQLRRAFRPDMPTQWKHNPRAWLSTFDILDVMRQYTDADRTFEFLGVFPVNFSERRGDSCVSRSMCGAPQLLERMLQQGKKHMGAVFNLDRDDEPGSHWVSLYACIEPTHRMYGVFYYDSMAAPPPPSIRDFMTELKQQVQQRNSQRRFRRRINCHRRQYQDTECGMYAMLFIITCMQDSKTRRFSRLCASFGSDDAVHQYRRVLYRPTLKN